MCDSKCAMPAPMRAWYMWTDSWNDAIAKRNPLRWGRPMSIGALVRDLEKAYVHWGRGDWSVGARLEQGYRPLRVFLEMQGGELEREFENTASAVLWLRGKFDCEDVPIPAARPSLGLFTSCTASPALADDDEVVVPSASRSFETEEMMFSTALHHTRLGTPIEAMQTPAPASVVPREADAALEESHLSDDSHHPTVMTAITPPYEEVSQEEQPPDLDSEQVRHAKLQYMWADAGILPIRLLQDLAQADPLRWSLVMTPQEVVKDLVADPCHHRPVKLRADMPGHREVKTFKSKESAVEWISQMFKIEADELPDRKCVICLDAQVSVMLMPCRHAVLCDDCAPPILASGDCPICRTGITNYAHGHFANDYVDLVQAVEARMERTQTAAYEGMYNNVRPMMVTGALLGTGAAACFVLAPAAAPVLAASAFAVGYLPWFATTVAHFENEDTTVTPTSFFTRDDLSQPLKLIAKTLSMAVVAPLAAVVFFIPYGLYAGLARPLARALVHGLVRVCAFAHVYAVCPTARALQVLSQSLLRLLRDIGYGAIDHVVLLGNLLASGALVAGNALVAIADQLRIQATYCYDNVVCPIAMCTYDNVLCPIGRGCQRGAVAVAHGISSAADVTYNYVLLPSGQALQRGLEALGNGCVTCAVSMYTYVLLPGGRGVVLVLKKTGEGIVAGAGAVYTYVLVPLASGIAAGATLLYSNVLVPLGQGTLRALQMLGNGIAVSAEFLYRNALAPLGLGLWTVLSALGSGSWAAVKALGGGLVTGATLSYSYVILPCARGIALLANGAWSGTCAVAKGTCAVANAAYQHILIPASQAIAFGASAVFVYVLKPCGSGLYTMGAATAEGVRAVSCTISHYGTVGAQSVYVYILQPSGQAICVVAVASGEAARACGREAQNAAVATHANVQHAVRESIQTLQSASRMFG